MATLDPSIILAGQSSDIVNALSRANDAAQNRLNYDRQNAMNKMLQEQGAGILAGDQNALNALAGYDPGAALGVQQTRLGMDATRQDMAFSAEKMQMARDEGKRMAEEALKAQAASLTADQLAAEQQQLESALSGAASFYQKGDRAGYDAWLSKLGLDPQEYSFDEFPAHAATFDGVLEAMKAFAPPAGPEWIAATPEQAANYGATAGQINTKTGEFKKGGDGGGITQTIRNPDGTETVIQIGGGGRPAGAKPTEGNLSSEGYLGRMKGAEKVFAELEKAGTTSLGLTDLPAVDSSIEAYKLTVPEQKLLQAQRDWVRAKLRKESGAVIGAEEMAAEIRQYFPQPGEGPEVAAQKKESRRLAEEQLRISAALPAEAANGAAGSGSPPATPAPSAPASFEDAWSKY